MKSQCISCGVEFDISGDFRGKTVKCPKCGMKMVFPSGFREYKVLSQKAISGSGVFDPEKVERQLNRLSLQGWRVVGCSTCGVIDMSLAGSRNEAMIILERSAGNESMPLLMNGQAKMGGAA